MPEEDDEEGGDEQDDDAQDELDESDDDNNGDQVVSKLSLTIRGLTKLTSYFCPLLGWPPSAWCGAFRRSRLISKSD